MNISKIEIISNSDKWYETKISEQQNIITEKQKLINIERNKVIDIQSQLELIQKEIRDIKLQRFVDYGY